MSNRLMIFTGNSNPSLSASIASELDLPIGRAVVGTFSDGETMIEILENVRGKDVFIIQSTSAPANNNLMELLTMADALRRSSAARITAVMPYFGYARQDRRVRSARVPITAKVVADMMSSVGICRILTVDLHADQIQGFFYMQVDNVYSTPVMLSDILKQNLEPLMTLPLHQIQQMSLSWRVISAFARKVGLGPGNLFRIKKLFMWLATMSSMVLSVLMSLRTSKIHAQKTAFIS